MADFHRELHDSMPPLPPQQQNPQQAWQNYQFSTDELRVLRECNSESFFQRSMPLSIGLGTTVFLAVRNGILKPNVKFGAAPKVLGAILVGYFAGKVSYQSKCAEKLMRLPNSQLAEMLRQRKRGAGFAAGTFFPESFDAGSSSFLAPDAASKSGYANDGSFAGAGSASSVLDWDSRPNISGLDDNLRPTIDSVGVYDDTELRIQPVKPGVSYDDLRRQNREEYTKKQSSGYLATRQQQQQQLQQQQQYEPLRSIEIDEPDNAARAARTNKYGDSWN